MREYSEKVDETGGLSPKSTPVNTGEGWEETPRTPIGSPIDGSRQDENEPPTPSRDTYAPEPDYDSEGWDESAALRAQPQRAEVEEQTLAQPDVPVGAAQERVERAYDEGTEGQSGHGTDGSGIDGVDENAEVSATQAQVEAFEAVNTKSPADAEQYAIESMDRERAGLGKFEASANKVNAKHELFWGRHREAEEQRVPEVEPRRISHTVLELPVSPRPENELPFGDLRDSGLTVDRTETLQANTEVSYAELRPNTEYVFGSHRYVTDAVGLPAYAAGELRLDQQAPRHRQGTAIGRVGEPTDHGGHLIAAMFGGFGSGPNLIPQNLELNRQGELRYGQMEKTWWHILKDGARVFVDIRVEQSGPTATRPDGIFVRWHVERDQSLLTPSSDLAHFVGGVFENYFENCAP